MATSYAVTARLDGRFWYIEIPALDGATQARNVGEIETMARDYIASVTDTPESSVTVDISLVLPAPVREHLETASRLRAEEAAARTGAAEASRAAARELKQAGLTMRDVGAVLGISHQRAQQLTSV